MKKQDFKVRKTTYVRLGQDALATYADNVVTRTFNVEAYREIATLVAALKTAQEAYATALAAAANRGAGEIARKDAAKATLVDALDAVADGLTVMAVKQEDSTLILEAGMDVQSAAHRTNADLAAPTGVMSSPTLTSGEMLIEFDPVEGATMYAFEWSDDNREHWQNGQYGTKVRKILSVAPRKEIFARVRAMGTRDRVGPWSEAVMSFVL